MTHVGTDNVSSILEFYSVNASDNGVYQCQLDYGKYGTTEPIEIIQYVRDIESIPIVIKTHHSNNISFNCTAYGDEGRIQWSFTNKNNTPVNISSENYKYDVKTEYRNYTTISELTIFNISIFDTGDYTCNMSYFDGTNLNSTGQVYVMGELYVYLYCPLIDDCEHHNDLKNLI